MCRVGDDWFVQDESVSWRNIPHSIMHMCSISIWFWIKTNFHHLFEIGKPNKRNENDVFLQHKMRLPTCMMSEINLSRMQNVWSWMSQFIVRTPERVADVHDIVNHIKSGKMMNRPKRTQNHWEVLVCFTWTSFLKYLCRRLHFWDRCVFFSKYRDICLIDLNATNINLLNSYTNSQNMILHRILFRFNVQNTLDEKKKKKNATTCLRMHEV